MNAGSQFTSYARKAQSKLRPIFIGLLVLLFMIPLNIVEGVVTDRTSYREEAVAGIAASWANAQTLMGPVLVIPYFVTEQIENFDPQLNKMVVTKQKVAKQKILIPETLNIDTTLKTEMRQRGLYKVPVYVADVKLQGTFAGLQAALSDLSSQLITPGTTFISLSITDVRGIGGTPEMRLNDKPYTVEPGTGLLVMASGLNAPLTTTTGLEQKFTFSMNFSLKGLNEFSVVPTGKTVEMKMQSDWPHPSFKGQFLPDNRTVTAEGFTANWKTGLLATNVLDLINSCALNRVCTDIYEKTSGVSLFQPVDIYTQSTRAIKYGLLFVALTFALFFVTETMKNVHVSLPQFLLVGGALAIFFLLLVSLAEHIGFALAYLAAAAATVALLSYYVSFVLRSRRQGLQTGALLAALYGILYVILLSEDYALLLGSLLLFLLIAGVMIITRNVDWENLGSISSDKEKL